MSREFSVEELLQWRLARAEADAPPAPRAAQLLERARPWWERWPERFQQYVQRVGRIQVAYAYAATESSRGRTGYPVPAVIAGADVETAARVLYFSIRDGQLRFRFQLDASSEHGDEDYEVTFVSEPEGRPLLSANAVASVENEYRVDVGLPEELVAGWEALKVTDRMPYRLILRPVVNGR
jgi:hypothetical protein